MAYNSLSVSSHRPQPVWRVYTGTLISSLIAIAERTANKIHSNSRAGELERDPRVGPLTVDEVLDNYAKYIDLARKAPAEAKELEEFEKKLAGRDAAIRVKYPVLVISGSWRSL